MAYPYLITCSSLNINIHDNKHDCSYYYAIDNIYKLVHTSSYILNQKENRKTRIFNMLNFVSECDKNTVK